MKKTAVSFLRLGLLSPYFSYYHPGRVVLDVQSVRHRRFDRLHRSGIGSFDYNVNVRLSSGETLIFFIRPRNPIPPHYIILLRSLRFFFFVFYYIILTRPYRISKALIEPRTRIKCIAQTVHHCVSGLKSSVQSVPPYSTAIVNSYRPPLELLSRPEKEKNHKKYGFTFRKSTAMAFLYCKSSLFPFP